jgi:hypothetical protein
VKGISYKVEAPQEETTGLGDVWETHAGVGVMKGTFTQDGAFFDTATNSSHDALSAGTPSTPQTAARVVCAGFAGNTIGSPMVGFEGAYQQTYEVLSQVGALTRANAEYVITGQVDQEAAVIHDLSAEVDAASSEANSVDNTSFPQRNVPITSSSVANPSTITCPVAHGLTTGDTVLIAGHSGSTPSINAEQTVTVVTTTTFTIPVNVTVGGTGGSLTVGETNNGGVGYLQITSLTLGGYTNVVITVRDSADDAAFGDLVAFTAATTSPSAERVTVAGEVLRYLAQDVAFGGAGSGESVTYLVGFKRS